MPWKVSLPLLLLLFAVASLLRPQFYEPVSGIRRKPFLSQIIRYKKLETVSIRVSVPLGVSPQAAHFQAAAAAATSEKLDLLLEERKKETHNFSH